ncbi:MAG: METTL5 family protein [Candidatus Thermoplasmatota archaeon]|jgi:putative methylase|nr:METTL5 family protein [Candidatus Thermoplasmatota archaeon]
MPLLNQKNLEIALQRLRAQKTYSNFLEQYPTDAHSASFILNLAFIDGNIESRKVADFGAGNGIFSVGSAMLGAATVYSVEIDPALISILRENSSGFGITIINASVADFKDRVDTVVMNPPFGSVKRGADFKFMEKAVEVSNFIYSLHNSKSREFVRNFYESAGEIFRMVEMQIRVARIYPHHRHDYDTIDSTLFCVKVSR